MDFIFDPALVLYLPLYQQDGVSFMSQDKHGHLCTVTGATWRPNGRYLDGTDDKLDCTDTALPSGANGRTIAFWLKRMSAGNLPQGGYLFKYGTFALPYGRAFSSYGQGGTTNIYFGGYGNDFDTGVDLDNIDWHHFTFTYDGTNVHVYLDLVEAPNSPTAKTLNTVLDGHFYLGYGSGGDYFESITGEVWVYNRVLTPQEIQHNYLATKWRYR